MGFIAQDGVPHIIVVRNLHIVEQDHIFELGRVAHHTVGAHQGVASDKCPLADLGFRADNGWSVDISGREYRGAFRNPDILPALFIFFWRKRFPQLADKRPDTGKRLPRIRVLLQIFRCRRVREVIQIANEQIFQHGKMLLHWESI